MDICIVCDQVPSGRRYSEICLIRHLKEIRKKWQFRQSDRLCKQPEINCKKRYSQSKF